MLCPCYLVHNVTNELESKTLRIPFRSFLSIGDSDCNVIDDTIWNLLRP